MILLSMLFTASQLVWTRDLATFRCHSKAHLYDFHFEPLPAPYLLTITILIMLSHLNPHSVLSSPLHVALNNPLFYHSKPSTVKQKVYNMIWNSMRLLDPLTFRLLSSRGSPDRRKYESNSLPLIWGYIEASWISAGRGYAHVIRFPFATLSPGWRRKGFFLSYPHDLDSKLLCFNWEPLSKAVVEKSFLHR